MSEEKYPKDKASRISSRAYAFTDYYAQSIHPTVYSSVERAEQDMKKIFKEKQDKLEEGEYIMVIHKIKVVTKEVMKVVKMTKESQEIMK